MKCIKWIGVGLALGCIAAVPAGAAQDSAGAVRVKLSRPSDPCFVECGLLYGGISVMAYDGDEVIAN